MKLKEYIQGNRKGKAAHRIEREALKDPFLYEALEGFDSVPDDHAEQIAALQDRITRAAAARPARRLWLRWSAAASLLLLLSLGGYLFLWERGDTSEALYSQHLETTSPDTLFELIEQSEQEESQFETPPQKLTTPSFQSSIEPQKKEQIRPVEKKATLEVQELAMADLEVQELAMAESLLAENDTIRLDFKDELQAIALVEDMVADSEPHKMRIKGRVTDQQGEPIVGASIMQQGTAVGTVSDIDGNFEIETDNSRDLQVRYLGYDSKDISVMHFSDSMHIALHEDTNELSEVVVIGYSTQKKSTFTGAVSSLPASDPEPVIGKKQYTRYLKDTMIHPTNEAGKKIKGKVKLSFAISREGRPIDIKVEKSLGEAADDEAIRLIENGPDWTWSDKRAEWVVEF